MRRRRLDDDDPITFFSFQDIVTSICGIMIIVAMLLVLDMTTAAFTPVELARESIDPAEVQARLEQVKSELASMETRIDALRRNREELASRSHTELSESIARLELRLAEFEGKELERDSARAELEKRLKDLKAQVRAKMKEIGDMARAKHALDAQQRKRVLFALEDQASERKTVLIEVSGREILVRRLDLDDVPIALPNRPGLSDFAGVLNALSKYPKEKFDVLIILKPSGFDGGRSLVGAIRASGYRTGYEPLEEDRTVMER